MNRIGQLQVALDLATAVRDMLNESCRCNAEDATGTCLDKTPDRTCAPCNTRKQAEATVVAIAEQVRMAEWHGELAYDASLQVPR